MPISATLKQKLSNLALSQSSPTNSSSSNASASPRRNVFNFARRGDNNGSEPIYDQGHAIDEASIDELMQRVIRQAGVDYETRPMVVITAAEFPDPRLLSYDLLFQRVLRQLDLYVESDYTVVFLVAGGRYAPGWSWVWKSYRSLNRKYRKNLKKLYIVHTTVFSKMLFSLAGTIISPKFFRKIQYIPTLSALAECVPLTNLDLHPAVYRENLKHERQIVIPGHHEQSQMFGVSLDKLMGEDGLSSGVPRAVKDCVEDIRERGLECEGLFRRSPNSAMLRHAKEAYDRGQPVSLSSFGDPHIAAVLLKKFFRDLPRPVFPESIYPVILACPPPSPEPSNRACIDYIRDSVLPLVENTSPATLIVLSYVLHLLHDVSLRSSMNKMDATNLALCFTPNLVAGSNIIRDTQISSIPEASILTSSIFSSEPTKSSNRTMTLGMLIKICIEQYFDIFEEIPDRTTAMHSHPSLTFSLPASSSTPSASSTYYGTPLDGDHLADSRRLDTPPSRHSSRGPVSPLSPSSESFTTAEDSDSDPDESMLIMPIGPSSPTTSSSSHHGAAFSSPPSAWLTGSPDASPGVIRVSDGPGRSIAGVGIGHPSSPLSHHHRRKDSALSGKSASTTGTRRGTGSAHDAAWGTLRPARSIISIERAAHGGSGVGAGGSIRIGRGGAGGTRRASSAGVEAIGVTAAGFFSPINGDPATDAPTSNTSPVNTND